MPNRGLVVRALVALAIGLVAFGLVRWGVGTAQADPKRPEGPVGTYQISSYSIPPTNTRPNWVLGYFLVDTRTGEVTREEQNIW
jgi:hypothetical protein